MKKLSSITIILVFVLCLTVGFNSIKAYADEIASGSCGSNLTWTLNSEGVLTISGSGAMNNYTQSGSTPSPFYKHRDQINSVIIGQNVTSIGNSAFHSTNITKIHIPDSVTSIGNGAFFGSKLESITVPKNVKSIGSMAFCNCMSLKRATIAAESIGKEAFYQANYLENVTLLDGVKIVGEHAFSWCLNLKNVTISDSVISIGNGAFGSAPVQNVYAFPNSCIAELYPDSRTKYQYQEKDNHDYLRFKSDRIVLKPNDTIRLSDYVDTNTTYEVNAPDGNIFLYDNDMVAALSEGEGNITICNGELSATAKLISASDAVEVAGIDISSSHIELNKGDSTDLSVTLEPFNTTEGGINWTSSDETIVCVNSGHIKAVGSGSAVITASSSSNPEIYATCEVEVIPKLKAIGVSNDLDLYTIRTGETKEITYLLYPYDSTDVNLSFSSSDESIISIDNAGIMTANDNGTVQITISSGSISKTINIVSYTPLEGISIKETSVQTKCGEKIQLSVIYKPANTTERDIKWSSNKESIAKVDENGMVSVCGKGIATITANAGVFSATCNIVSVDHAWDEEKITEKPTCTETGVKSRTCTICGETESTTLPALGHAWNEEPTVDKDATCIEDGSQSIHCSVCGVKDESTVEVIPARGHSWNTEPTVDKNATCTEDGSQSIHCSVCGVRDESTVEVIPRTGHKWAEPTYSWSDDKTTVIAKRVCEYDSTHKETESVNTSSEVTKAATYTAMGQTTYTAVFTNPAFKEQTKVETNIDKLPKMVNTLTVKAKKPTVKYSKLKKKAQTITVKKAFTVSKPQGKVTYKVKKYDKKAKKKITVSKTGKVTVKKGLKKGTYKITVNVTAAGTTQYKALTKAVTLTIKVK